MEVSEEYPEVNFRYLVVPFDQFEANNQLLDFDQKTDYNKLFS